ncbi:pimeloyl-ACP methyl ester carboxylesterase [Microbacterium sp. W4I4]|uniref:alpha/beta fold hydrolase n=1 Tax=Microbacterium sp. W4I4 TaxID=3042295 RepID=UPI00278B3784|nr:alpha/beta hydrolase [Microbacterium sp. W4I4]MDQ0614705.1 pimeloyl-ACP methyl ester carboxylesterase [Microbacterium sp. W4I4]
MSTTTSADGTTISFTATGEGRTVVIVNGALSTAADAGPLSDALTDAGFRAVVWDRRARGASGDHPDSTPKDEADDLAAVIDAAGGADAVLGHSSGAVLALYAAMRGVPTGALFLSEPPIDFDGSGFGDEMPERLQAFVDAGRPEEAVASFQREAIGLPAEMVEAGRASGQLAALAPLAQSTVYDTRLTLRLKQVDPTLLDVSASVTVLRGAQTFPFLLAASDRLASVMDGAELVVVPESVMHRPDPAATARVIAERLPEL